MAIPRTSLLDLPLPVTGSLSGDWGAATNNGLTEYLDIAVAGSLVLNTDADVTLTSTDGDENGTNIGSTTAQYAILRWTATGSTTRNITVPAKSKTYIVINATGGTQSIVLRGAGPTTGVTIVAGEKAVCAWNGSDFVKVGGAAGGTNTQVQYNNGGVFGGVSGATTNGTAITFSTTNLKLQGSSTGVSSFASANASATDYTVTFPAASTTIPVATQTLTFSGPTAARTITLPDANFTAARTDSAQTFTGVQTFSSNPILSGGTANGVLYLNGSSVATSGSALTFDGTTFQYTGAANFATSSGNVGIGTTSPTTFSGFKTLELANSSGNAISLVTGSSVIAQTISSSANSAVYMGARSNHPLYLTTNDTIRAILDTSGNLGLGVTPQSWNTDTRMIDIGASVSVGNTYGGPASLVFNGVQSTASSGAWRYRINASVPAGLYTVDSAHKWYTAPSGTAGNAITFTQAMTLDASGNLGVGATSPGAKLDVKQSGVNWYDGIRVSRAGVDSQRLVMGNTDGASFIASVDAAGGNNNELLFGNSTNGTTFNERARITSGGNFGIGTASPSSILDVQKAGTAASTTDLLELTNSGNAASMTNTGTGILFNQFYYDATTPAVADAGRIAVKTEGNWTSTASTQDAYMTFETALDGTVTERARITSGGVAVFRNGPVGSGQGATIKGVQIYFDETNNAGYIYSTQSGVANYPLYILGTEVYVGGTTDNGAYNFQCNGTGVWGAGAYVNGSDARLKDNIQTLNDGLAVVSQLRPVTFQYKTEYSKDQSVQPGFIAQELQQAMAGKDYVDGVVQSGPEYLSVAYQNLIPILTKAIQEQQALITSLTARVAALEGTQP